MEKIVKNYRMYVDESGDHTYTGKERYLCLTGIVFESQYYKDTFHPTFQNFKQKHFPHNPDEPVVLHRRDILDKSGAFWRLRDKQKEKDFNKDFIDILINQKYITISSY